MPTIRRVTPLVTTVALLLGACAGVSPTVSPQSTPAGFGNVVTTAAPTRTAVASPSPSAAAVRPGLILLEHLGNGLDGTKLNEKKFLHLWLVRADGSGVHELNSGQPIVEGVVADKGAGDWSPDGTHIVFASTFRKIPLIYEIARDGTTPRLVSTDCAPEPVSCFEFFPSYSPDGKRIAFVRLTDDGANGVLAIRDLATGKVTTLESTRQGPPKNELGAPAWSPDGKRLVYFEVSKGPEGTPPASSELFIVNGDGTGRHHLSTPGLAAGDPRWSPDGSRSHSATNPSVPGEIRTSTPARMSMWSTRTGRASSS